MIKVLFLFFPFFLQLHAHNSLLSTYRTEGIEKVEQILNDRLMSTKSWKNVLQDINTTFGYFENTKTFLVCDKNSSTLDLYLRNSKNSFHLESVFRAFTGKMKGDKQVEGDLKTPNGIYTLTKKIQSVDEFYGPMAFVTSYPNIYDQLHSKNGSGIWIHGLPLNNEKRDAYTKGCIAIKNSDIICLDPNLFINNTLLYIDDKVEFKHTKKDLALLLSSLFQWKNAWKKNELEKYLSFYDKTFVHSVTKKDFNAFKKFKTRIFSYHDKKSIIFKNIAIVPYPSGEDEKIFRISFLEKYKSKRITFSGNKILIVKLENNQMKILTEK